MSTIVRLPDYKPINGVEPNCPRRLADSLRAAKRIDERGFPQPRTNTKKRAYALTPLAIAYLKERKP